MKRNLSGLLLLIMALILSFCEQKQEISPERFKVLADTLTKDMDYEPWMDFAMEMSQNYPEEYTAAKIMLQATERAIHEQDAQRFETLFNQLKNYPENGTLEITDQIAFGNRIAWLMSEQTLLIDKAPQVMAFTLQKFKDNETSLQWRDELGAMIYDTQANVYQAQNKIDQALEAYGTAIDYYEQPETLLRRGTLLEQKGALQAALDDYISALGHAPAQAMITSRVKAIYTQLNPTKDVDSFMADLQQSLQETRKEEVLAEASFNDTPEFELTDLNGQVLNNTNLLGKVVFVDFWATWCNPCRRELPEFQTFYNKYKDNPRVAFIAASTDSEPAKVQPFVEQMGFSFPIALAGEVATKFGVEGIPSLFIIGPSGKIRYKIVGFDPDKDFVMEMSWRLESLLDS